MFVFIRPIVSVIVWVCAFIFLTQPVYSYADGVPVPDIPAHTAAEKYHRWHLSEAGLDQRVFMLAIKGYEKMQQKRLLKNNQVITIIDFSKSSGEKRLYVIDLQSGALLFNTLVAHGRNSGKERANSFSNVPSSLESSPGFYTTGDTYQGKHGYSLRLQGCESGWNDRAMERAIVVHGADYVSESFIQQNGYLGRSHGCPAIPTDISEAIIKKIRSGSCLFIYAPLQTYLQNSHLLN